MNGLVLNWRLLKARSRLQVAKRADDKAASARGYEQKRSAAEGRANGACVRNERRGTARRQFA